VVAKHHPLITRSTSRIMLLYESLFVNDWQQQHFTMLCMLCRISF